MRRSPCLLLSRTLPLDLGQASIPESNAFAICKSNLSNGSPLRFDDNGRPDLWSYLSENLSQKWPNRLVLFHAFIVHLFHLAMRRGPSHLSYRWLPATTSRWRSETLSQGSFKERAVLQLRGGYSFAPEHAKGSRS